MDSYEYRFRDAAPQWNGEELEDVVDSCKSMGYHVYHSDLKTTRRTTSEKIHGVYVIILLDGEEFHLLSGTYNYLCPLEGKASIGLMIQYSPAMQSFQRWSKWSNPMKDKRKEAWADMWRTCRTFKSERDLKSYIITHMKNWDDVGNTLYYARRANI